MPTAGARALGPNSQIKKHPSVQKSLVESGLAHALRNSSQHKTTRPELGRGFGSKPVQIRSTPKADTPYGGLCGLCEFFNKIGLASKLQEVMPFTLASPNALPPAHTLMACLSSVIAGAKRFAHTDWLRSDKALHVMLGIERFSGADTVRNLFARFTQACFEAFWRPLWRWLCLCLSHQKKASVWICILPYSNEALLSPPNTPTPPHVLSPFFGHMRGEHRLERNRLRGTLGNAINVLLSATAMNFGKLIKRVGQFRHLFPPC